MQKPRDFWDMRGTGREGFASALCRVDPQVDQEDDVGGHQEITEINPLSANTATPPQRSQCRQA